MCLLGGWFAYSPMSALAHEDMDISIESVMLDESCHAVVSLKNVGHRLPKGFYLKPSNAHITLKKGEQFERLPLLAELDVNRSLQPAGGELVIKSTQTFANNPAHFLLQLVSGTEYADHGMENNTLRSPMDCTPGVGQTEGEPIRYTQPDLSLSHVKLNQTACTLSFEIHNLTAVPLPESAWAFKSGVQIKLFNVDKHREVQSFSLLEFDAEKTFTRQSQHLHGSVKIPKMDSHHLRLGLWFVPDDLNFKNNQIEINLPAACRSNH